MALCKSFVIGLVAAALGLTLVVLSTACAPSATPTPTLTPTSTPTLPATPTPTPRPARSTGGVFTPEDERAQYESVPEGYKFAIDEDTVVMFAYPSPALDFAGFAFIHHIPSVSSVTLNRPAWVISPDGTRTPALQGQVKSYDGQQVVVTTHYQSDEGRARLEAVLADEEVMKRIVSFNAWPPASSAEDFHVDLRYEPEKGLSRRVRLFADITGGADDSRELYCKETRWEFGDGMVSMMLPDCEDWKPGAKATRHFETTYSYQQPGEYLVTFSYGNVKGGPMTVRVAW